MDPNCVATGRTRNQDSISRLSKSLPDAQGMAGEELPRGQASSALALKRDDAQGPLAARDHDAMVVCRKNRAWRSGSLFVRFGLTDFEQLRFWFRGQKSIGAGPGNKRANTVPHTSHRLGPIQTPVFFRDLASVTGARTGLLAGNNLTGDIVRDRLDQQLRAQGREPVVQRLRVLIGSDARGLLTEDVAGVEALVHFHDGDAGFALVVQEGPLNRRRAAIFGQEGGMDVQAAEARQREDLCRQNLAISGHRNQVGLKPRQWIEKGLVAGAFRLQDVKLFLRRQTFHRRRLPMQMASLGPVRLRDDTDDDAVRQLRQGRQTGAGQFGGAKENDSQRRHEPEGKGSKGKNQMRLQASPSRFNATDAVGEQAGGPPEMAWHSRQG